MKIFYYWESPPGSGIPDYLQMCIETWSLACPGVEIIKVDQSNLAELSGGRVSVANLARFSYPLQSDIAAVSVLLEQPGIFMDADIVLLPGFDPNRYDLSKLTLYGEGIESGNQATGFFVTGRPENPLLRDWLEEANCRINAEAKLVPRIKWWIRRKLRGKPVKVSWNYLANSIVDDMARSGKYSSVAEFWDSGTTGFYPTTRLLAENPQFSNYKDLWFDASFPVSEVLRTCEHGIAFLQNSWHPSYYKAKSRQEILNDDALISRLITQALA